MFSGPPSSNHTGPLSEVSGSHGKQTDGKITASAAAGDSEGGGGRVEILDELALSANVEHSLGRLEASGSREGLLEHGSGERGRDSLNSGGGISIDMDGSSAAEEVAEFTESGSDSDDGTEGSEAGARPRQCVVIQGPDELLYIGQEVPVASADGAQLSEPLLFAASSRGTAPGMTAHHIWMPSLPTTPRTLGGVLGAHIASGEALLNPYESVIYLRRKRAFIFLLLLGSIFYIFSFITGIVLNSREQSNTTASSSLDYVSHSMLTSTNVSVAMAYLIMYLTLDMVGLAGALLDNGHLMMVYIVVETVLLAVFALREHLKPFIVFRLVIIMFGFQVRSSIVHIQIAERSLLERAGQLGAPQGRRALANRTILWPSLRGLHHQQRMRRLFSLSLGQQNGLNRAQAWRGGGGRPRRWNVSHPGTSPVARDPGSVISVPISGANESGENFFPPSRDSASRHVGVEHRHEEATRG